MLPLHPHKTITNAENERDTPGNSSMKLLDWCQERHVTSMRRVRSPAVEAVRGPCPLFLASAPDPFQAQGAPSHEGSAGTRGVPVL